mmetsp:Transcript_15661/g.34469  ORF Transcript_15661/g.34469 Transcript_15661/m.34469 type:complete len:217 (-) Transcript_15661:1013-1663(-)
MFSDLAALAAASKSRTFCSNEEIGAFTADSSAARASFSFRFDAKLVVRADSCAAADSFSSTFAARSLVTLDTCAVMASYSFRLAASSSSTLVFSAVIDCTSRQDMRLISSNSLILAHCSWTLFCKAAFFDCSSFRLMVNFSKRELMSCFSAVVNAKDSAIVRFSSSKCCKCCFEAERRLKKSSADIPTFSTCCILDLISSWAIRRAEERVCNFFSC